MNGPQWNSSFQPPLSEPPIHSLHKAPLPAPLLPTPHYTTSSHNVYTNAPPTTYIAPPPPHNAYTPQNANNTFNHPPPNNAYATPQNNAYNQQHYNNNVNNAPAYNNTTQQQFTATKSHLNTNAPPYSPRTTTVVQQHTTSQRETGVIEKVVTSYGFIRCNERKARVFFHFSEFNGDPISIIAGDVVEFHIENHPKTGKPLACDIIRFEPIPPPLEVLSEEKFHGSLVKEAKPSLTNGCLSAHTDGMLTYQNCGESFFVPYASHDICGLGCLSAHTDGMLTYQNCGESFFVPYASHDICGDPNIKMNPGDHLVFYVATDPIGNMRAREVELITPTTPPILSHPSPVDVAPPPFPPPTQPTLPTHPHALSLNSKPSSNHHEPPLKSPTITPTSNMLQPHFPTSRGPRLQGVICSLKETFGFIERSDVVKEIFFHYSEFSGEINLGQDVEFELQFRNNKEVAIHIHPVPKGTVIFEDIGSDRYTGTVSRVAKHDGTRHLSDPLSARIVYETPNGQQELPFGDKDQNGDFTLMVGDVVRFRIATDRRDKLERASDIDLQMETLDLPGKNREMGVIESLKSGFGFIQCTNRDARIFFHFSEIIPPDWEPLVNDHAEFTVIMDPSSPPRQMAIRLRRMSPGSNEPYTVLPEKYIGTVNSEAGRSNGKSKPNDPGKIVFDYKSVIKSIQYYCKDVADLKSIPRAGDKIEFQISEQKTSGAWKAISVKLVLRGQHRESRDSSHRQNGFIATLKENFGFIEMADHEKEIFFHFSAYDGDPNDLDLGDELEFSVSRKNSKVSAENIRPLSKGTIAPEDIKDNKVLTGEVVRPMRMVNPDQDEYSGLVQAVNEDNVREGPIYPYGITSLADNRDFLQEKDAVKFQVGIVKATGKERAINVAAKRSYIRAMVDSVKGQYGFLQYDADVGKKLFFHMTEVKYGFLQYDADVDKKLFFHMTEYGFLQYDADVGKKLFFHMTEVHDNVEVNPGDEVEFVVVKNQRNGKYSACSLRKISNTQRPDRLLTRHKSRVSVHEIKQTFFAIRQPKGPDGSKGFTQPRKPWKPVTA